MQQSKEKEKKNQPAFVKKEKPLILITWQVM